MLSAAFLVPALVVRLAGGVASAQQLPRAVCSNVPGSPTSVVPGPVSWTYRAGFDASTSMPRVVVSPSGTHWAMAAWINSGGTERLAVIHGAGLSPGGTSLVARVGAASFVSGRAYETLEQSIGVNDAGQVAFAGNLTGATGDDQFAARWAGGTLTPIAREGQALPGAGTGALWGSIIDCVSIAGDGSLAARTLLAGGASGQAWVRGASASSAVVLAQANVTTPSSQLFAPAQAVHSLVFDQCTGDHAGVATLVRARLNGPAASDQVTMLATPQGAIVVAQEGAPLPGSQFTSHVTSLSLQDWGLSIAPAGAHWAALGTNADANDWATIDNQVFVRTGDAVAPGSAEVFDDAMFSMGFSGVSVTDSGAAALAGHTQSGQSIAVLVNDRVLLREGDAVDVNANTLPDDNAYIDQFAEGGLWLTNAERLFAVVTLATGDNQALGVALITLDVSQCNDIDFNNDALFPDTDDLAAFLSVFAGGPCPTPTCDDIDFNRDALFPDTDDLAAFLSVFAGGPC